MTTAPHDALMTVNQAREGAGEPPLDEDAYVASEAPFLSIWSDDGTALVHLYRDGHATFDGEQYRPDVAALAFWSYLQTLMAPRVELVKKKWWRRK